MTVSADQSPTVPVRLHDRVVARTRNRDRVAQLRRSVGLAMICLVFLEPATNVSHAQYADTESCTVLADYLPPGPDYEKSVKRFGEAVAELDPALKSGLESLPDGWLYLVYADCYRRGIVVEQDRELGNELLRVAASEGNAQAAHMIASIDVFQSDDADRQRAGVETLEKEYREGSAYSAGKLGWAYQLGLGVEQDISKAMELYEYAAESGMTYWQYLLAHAYEQGYLGLDVDEERAGYWREFTPKAHIAFYECWVAEYYDMGIFPEDELQRANYRATCDSLGASSDPELTD